jgi:hypothetical protein
MQRVPMNVADPLQREAILKHHREATAFWNARHQMATVD